MEMTGVLLCSFSFSVLWCAWIRSVFVMPLITPFPLSSLPFYHLSPYFRFISRAGMHISAVGMHISARGMYVSRREM